MTKSKKDFKFNFKISDADIKQFENFNLFEKELGEVEKDKNCIVFLHDCDDGNFDSIKKIIKNKLVDINYKNEYNKTGLIYASKSGHINIVKFLVENGANLNIQDVNQNTALMHAIFYNNVDVIEYLIIQGSDLSLKNIHGSIIHNATSIGNLKIIDELYNRGCDIEEKDENGNTCVFIATLNSNYDVVKYLIKKSVNLNLLNNMVIKDTEHRENVSLLHICIKYDLFELMLLFIRNKINLNIKNNFNETPLKYACRLNKIIFVKLLLQKGANPNITSPLNYSCLHCAIDNKNLEMVKLLIDYGADYNLKTLIPSIHTKPCDNQSILAYAKCTLNYNIVNYLDSKNAVYFRCY